MARKIFQVSISADGKLWTRYEDGDSDNYIHVSRNARDRSLRHRRYERISNHEVGIDIVTFRNGMSFLSDTRIATSSR